MPIFPPSGKPPLDDSPLSDSFFDSKAVRAALVGAPKLTDFKPLTPDEVGALALQAMTALSSGHHPASTGIQISLDNLCRLLMSCEPIESKTRRVISDHADSPIEGYGPTLTTIRWSDTDPDTHELGMEAPNSAARVTVTHSRYDSSTGSRSALAGRGTSVDEALADLTFQQGPLSEILRFREE